MNFELNEEQLAIQQMAKDFAERKLVPIASELDHEARYPKEIIQEMGQLQLMGMAVSEEFGGAGTDFLSYILALEQISKACASTGVIMSVNNSLVCNPLKTYGTDDQKKKYLKALASGEQLGCYALSEPGSGSDAASLRTTAKKSGDHFILNGTKQFITNGEEADVAIIYATTDLSKGSKGICAFIVETKSDGFKISKEKKLGIRGSSCVQLVLDNVKVPVTNILGKEGEGFKIALATLEIGRIGIAAQALGIGGAALDCSLKYSKEREQFGKSISNFQAIQFMLADMAIKLEAAQLLTYKAAKEKGEKKRTPIESSHAKLFASEMAMFNSWAAIQIHGGYGYVEEYLPERLFRDAKVCEIYEGTSEVQRMVISRTLLKD